MKLRDCFRRSIPFVLLLFNGYLSLSIYSRSGVSYQFIVTAGGTAIVVFGLFFLNLYVDSKITKQDGTPQLNDSWPPAVKDLPQPEAQAAKPSAHRHVLTIALLSFLVALCAASAAITIWVLEHPKLFHIHV